MRDKGVQYRRERIDNLIDAGIDTYAKLEAEMVLITAGMSKLSAVTRSIIVATHFLVNRKPVLDEA